MSALVHIKLSDRGWILEKQAMELCGRLPYVSYGLDEDRHARIQYYMTYGCRTNRVSPIEIGFFTHQEREATAKAAFEHGARNVDVCVAMANATKDIISSFGVQQVEVISQGVDLDTFYPVVRIGVVGRTYTTGRKGEDMVTAVMDIPGIEWHFTGHGWPGPSQHVPDEQLPDFYRSLDYVLVPSYEEGGPMSVLEALACGCPVIAPGVGWVPQFPHIEFNVGDIPDLRRVLAECVTRKQVLRRHVEPYSWATWSHKHHALFVRLLGFDPTASSSSAPPPPVQSSETATATDLTVALVTHGGEIESGIGGPSVRVPKTAEELRKLGVRAESMPAEQLLPGNHHVVHVFNVWPTASCENALRRVERSRAALVFSPIFLDFSELSLFETLVPMALENFEHPQKVDTLLAALVRNGEGPGHYPDRKNIARYHAVVRRLVSYADHLVLLSEHEQKSLSRIGVHHPSVSIVKNAIDTNTFTRDATPGIFAAQFGVRDYVLCVGRIEKRKNQAMLAYAMRGSGIPLVLVGHEADPAYADLVRRIGGSGVIFCGKLAANSAMLASTYAGARVFCLPSWMEGASLSAMEAAAAGCPLVLSNRASEKEYFGDHARYIDPLNPEMIRNAVTASYAEGRSKSPAAQKISAALEHGWHIHTQETLLAYRKAIAAKVLAHGNRPPAAASYRIDLRNTGIWHTEAADSPPLIAHLQAELGNTLPTNGFLIQTDRDENVLVIQPDSADLAKSHDSPQVEAMTRRLPSHLIRYFHKIIFPTDVFTPPPSLHPWLKDAPISALARYAFAAGRIKADARVLDLSCGPGYGPYLLATTTGYRIVAYDELSAHISYARKNWWHKRIDYRDSLPSMYGSNSCGEFDIAIAFIRGGLKQTPITLLNRAFDLIKPGGALIFSLPNEILMSHADATSARSLSILDEFQIFQGLAGNGRCLELFGQSDDTIWSLLRPNEHTPSQYIIGIWRHAPPITSCGKLTPEVEEVFVYRPDEYEIRSMRDIATSIFTFKWSRLKGFLKMLIRRRKWIANKMPLIGNPIAGILRHF